MPTRLPWRNTFLPLSNTASFPRALAQREATRALDAYAARGGFFIENPLGVFSKRFCSLVIYLVPF
jgi:hypothetical protein